jgi:SAM-dependent methyltransferase
MKRDLNAIKLDPQARCFYDNVYDKQCGSHVPTDDEHEPGEMELIERFRNSYCTSGGPTLDAGCGHGSYQDMLPGYVGVDISINCSSFIRHRYAVGTMAALPFRNESFPSVVSLHTLEHVPHPELAMSELFRVLRTGGALLLLPSWQVRPWAASGISVAEMSDLTLGQKAAKLLLPVRNSLFVRCLNIVPRRITALCHYLIRRAPVRFRYRQLKPNYEAYLNPDSDACNWIDAFDAILFFHSRGCVLPELPGWWKKLSFRTGPLLVVKASDLTCGH